MIESIIYFAVRQKLIIMLGLVGIIAGGIYSIQQLPIDAVPDITNNQVQIVTVSNNLAPQEVEQFITYPVEVAMANIPNVLEIRSISRFGLSVVTVVFEDNVPILEARQFVKEQISMAEADIPAALGIPEMMPITTGLGEIYQYVLTVEPGYQKAYDATTLRTIQDWIVKRQLAGTPGIIEVSSFGGYLKQYEVALDPILLESFDISVAEVFEALAKNNQNSGGSYIEKNTNAYYIRTEGIVKSLEDIEKIVVTVKDKAPILIKNIGTVGIGSPKRFGAMTMDGKGEAVGGIALMLKGANSSQAIANVQQRIEEIKKSLPQGVGIYPYLDRSTFVGKTIRTVEHNLLEGGIIVILVLILLLGNFRAGLIVASVIPLAMLFALIMMNLFNVSANLMSLGAIDFGIVVDGAVIIVEGVLHTLFTVHIGKKLTQDEMDGVIASSSSKLFRSAFFGVLIILVVFVPIITLTGIEGKMFRPMAMTFSFAILGALILSLTYVPAIAALFLKKDIQEHLTWSDKLMNALKVLYLPVLNAALKFPKVLVAIASSVLVITGILFSSMGSEFIPTLEEGDLAMQMTIQPGSALQESIASSTKAEQVLLENFPEINHVVSKIGTAEVPTDPMAIEDADIMIILKDKEEWTSANSREELVEKMKEKLAVVAGVSFEFTQPIQLRFNELMTGAKTDVAVKIFGENTEILKVLGDQTATIIEKIDGAGDVKVEQTEGLTQLRINYDRDRLAQYGASIEELNTLVKTAYAGETAGVVFENERKFDLVVRLAPDYRDQLNLKQLFIHLPDGSSLPLAEVASLDYVEGPMQISREDAKRRINIGVNVRNRDVASLVAEIQETLGAELKLPAGYSIQYGGEFENLEAAQKRLSIAVPVALFLILILLYFTFGKIKYALLIFTAVPLSAIGGIIALLLRGMPFSISAGVGFIALFGVAVLNGIVLISHFNKLRYEDGMTDLLGIITTGSLSRLRPVLMTAIVAALGFLPMALSTSNGAEVQKPLATVVIGGLITATLLTLVVMPALYYLVNRKTARRNKLKSIPLIILLIGFALPIWSQPTSTLEDILQNLEVAHPQIQQMNLSMDQIQLGIDHWRKLPGLETEAELGQTNTDLLDYKFTIRQSFGNRAADMAIRKGEMSLKSITEAQKNIMLKAIRRAVKGAWYQWQYDQYLTQLEENRVQVLENLLEKAKVTWEAGAIDQLELVLVENNLNIANRQLANARAQTANALAKLSAVALLNNPLELRQNGPPEPLPFPAGNYKNENLIQPFLLQTQYAENQVAVAKAALQPQWTLGYFNQSIRPDFSLQGLTLGASVPLWRKEPKAKIERAIIEVASSKIETDLQSKLLNTAYQRAQVRAQLYQNRITENGTQLLTNARLLEDLANVQLTNGAIDFFKFVLSLESVFQAKREYYQLINDYNQAIINLEYYIQ